MYQAPVGGKAAPSEVVHKAESGTQDETAPVVEPKVRLARIACAAVLFAVAGTEFVSVVLTRDLVIASLWAIFGFGALGTGYYLYRGRFTAWGTAMILDVFALLLALATLDLYVFGALLFSFVVLYVFRLPFGVGAWKIESAKENDRSRTLIGERTRNPAGVTCPKCGADTLWVAGDGSAFCLTCRAGTIELARRDPS
jgi:hypothetical protein